MKTFISILLICLTLVPTTHVVAQDCGKSSRMLIPSFISSQFSSVYQRVFIDPLKIATHCQTELTVSRTLAKQLRQIKTAEYGSVMVPAVYAPYAKQFGYEPLLFGGDFNAILITQKNSTIKRVSDLKGKRILLHDELHYTSVIWRQWQQKAKLKSDQVKILYGDTLDGVIWQLHNNEADAAITASVFLEVMSPTVDAEFSIIKTMMIDQAAVILVHQDVPSNIKQNIKMSLMGVEDFNWSEQPSKLTADAVLDEKIRQILQAAP